MWSIQDRNGRGAAVYGVPVSGVRQAVRGIDVLAEPTLMRRMIGVILTLLLLAAFSCPLIASTTASRI